MLLDLRKLKNTSPILTVAYPDKREIGAIKGFKLQADICFNAISSASFTTYRKLNGVFTPNYDSIIEKNLIEINKIGWFIITRVSTTESSDNESKEVTIESLEKELCYKKITELGALGVESDEQGGLDWYSLYDAVDVDHSILHLVMQKAVNWSEGSIDSNISTTKRAFSQDSITPYSLLTGEVSTEYECIFDFNTYERTISAHKQENIGNHTKVLLSHRNVIKDISKESSDDDLITLLSVAGGDDGGAPLQINDVNLAGSNYIFNVNYFKERMSEELQAKIAEYETACTNNKSAHEAGIARLNALYDELNTLEIAQPGTTHSTVWSEYGITALESEVIYYNSKMSTALHANDTTLYSQYYALYIQATQNLASRKEAHERTLNAIEAQQVLNSGYTVNIKDFLGTTLYAELDNYLYESEFVDDNFATTDIMSEAEKLEKKKDLLSVALAKLNEMSTPTYTLKINASNFIVMDKYQYFTDQIKAGDFITVEYEEGKFAEFRLLKIHYNFEDAADFELTFSNANSLADNMVKFTELQKQAQDTSTTQTVNGTGWNVAKNQASVVSDWMNNALNLAKQRLESSNHQDFYIDDSGLHGRKYLEDSDTYSKKQIWQTNNGIYLTNDAWETVKTAIGEIRLDDNTTLYGIAAEVLMGELLIGKNLYLADGNNTMTFKEDGLTVTNGTNTVRINPSDTELFKILKGDEKVLYFDSDGNGTFSGNIKAKGGTIGGFTIDETSLTALSENSLISGGKIDGAAITATNAYFTRATLDDCKVEGKLEVPKNSTLLFQSDSSENVLQIGLGKITTNGSIAIFNDDIYCNKLYIGAKNTDGINKGKDTDKGGTNIADMFRTKKIKAEVSNDDSRLIKFSETLTANECVTTKAYVDTAISTAIASIPKK